MNRASHLVWISVWSLVAGCGDSAGSGGGDSTSGPSVSSSTTAATSTTTGTGGEDPAITTVMTWNLEKFPKSSATINAVQAVLNQVRPDVVGLQELDSEADFEALTAALPDYQGLLAMSGDGFVRVGTLYRPDRISISNAQMVFADDGYAFPRPMLAFDVTRHDRPGEDFRLGIVHLKAQLDAESTERRRSACSKIDTWIGFVQNEIDPDVVVIGDFNDELTDPPQWNVYGPLLDQGNGGFLTLPLEQASEYSYIPFKSFIDHILVRSPSLFAESSADVLELDLESAGYVSAVSDHRPVLARLRFAP